MPGYDALMTKPSRAPKAAKASGETAAATFLAAPTDRIVRADGSQVIVEFPFDLLPIEHRIGKIQEGLRDVHHDLFLSIQRLTEIRADLDRLRVAFASR
jgi:hypothetical protein